MERYDQLYRLYEDFDAGALRAAQGFIDLFPPVDSRVALERWQEASDDLEARKDEIRAAFPAAGETFADVAATASRDQAFTALDLASKYRRAVNVLVLDVDETLRSAGGTDNEIPRETLHLLTQLHEEGVYIVVSTGQTLENVKGFMIQGLGSELVHSGTFSIVYEGGTGVFTPGHGADTKKLLFEDLDREIRAIFERVRSRVLSEAPGEIRRGCHLQGNEFNVTLKPNFETGSTDAREVIDRALVYQLDLLGEAVHAESDADLPSGDGENGGRDGEEDDGTAGTAADRARAYYAARDPEIRTVLEREGAMADLDPDDVPEPVHETFERIDVAYYEADAAEITSLELNKVVGVQAAFDVLGVEDPFTVVMGDSKSDLRVMRWVAEEGCGVSAAPEHASAAVLDHVTETDELVFAPGKAGDVLRTVYALNRLVRLE